MLQHYLPFNEGLLSLLASGVLTQPPMNQFFWFLALWIAFFSIVLFLMPVPYILVFFLWSITDMGLLRS